MYGSVRDSIEPKLSLFLLFSARYASCALVGLFSVLMAGGAGEPAGCVFSGLVLGWDSCEPQIPDVFSGGFRGFSLINYQIMSGLE